MKKFSPLYPFYRWRESVNKHAEAVRHRNKMKAFYSQFVGKDDLCFDIGANLGNRTSIFLDIGSRVISVEPQPLCVKRLRKLFGKNENVVIVDAAVGEHAGHGELFICEDEPTISTMSEKWKTEGRFSSNNQWQKNVAVEVTTLDNLIAGYGLPRFCKIDVEGFELSVIKGLSEPIPFISFEFAREFFADAKNCMDYLLSIGPAAFNISYGESMELLDREWMTPEEIYERVGVEEDALLWGDIYVRFP